MPKAKDVTINVFLWFLFIVIALFLAFWLYNIYQEYMVSGVLEESTTSSLQCGGYMFKISDVRYDNNSLSFTIRNTMGNIIKNLTIESDYEARTKELVAFSSGKEMRIALENFRIADTFAVYPEGCAKFNVKIINISG